MNESEMILLDSFCGSLGLEIVFAGRGRVTLSSYSVLRPGLQFAGYFKYFDSSRITREDPDEVLADLIRLIVSVSNGEKRTRNEENGNMEIAYNMHANPGKTDQE